ncbi:MAG: hypothetical protein D6713_06160 [Deltaproteobacteria bacterium]|nr:MAG: hypothetical protein D6713_06160 [Deltaproteobacteria bacterium]
MNCRELINLLADYLDGSMDPELREELERHISMCEPCMNFLRTYDRTRIITRQVRIEEIPEEFRSRLKSFLLKKIREGRGAVDRYTSPQKGEGEE